MLRGKALRRRCDWPACGKLYRHSDPRSRTCSAACRMRLWRARQAAAKAAAQVGQEQVGAEIQDQARAFHERWYHTVRCDRRAQGGLWTWPSLWRSGKPGL